MILTSSQTPASALHHRRDVIAVFEAVFEDGEGERIEEVLLDGAFEGARAEDGIETGVGEVAGGVVGDGELEFCLARRSMTPGAPAYTFTARSARPLDGAFRAG